MGYSQLEELHTLKEKGILTEEEYQQQKAKILSGSTQAAEASPGLLQQKNLGMPTNTYLLIMHLVQLVPTVGWIASVIMWVINKDKDAAVDAHGKHIVNWLISALIYGFVFGLLCLLFIGIPFVIALGICCLVFPIIGAIKANNGEEWKYPLSISIIK